MPRSKRFVQLAAARAAQRPPAPPEPGDPPEPAASPAPAAAPPAPAPEEDIQSLGGLHRRLEAFTAEEDSAISSPV